MAASGTKIAGWLTGILLAVGAVVVAVYYGKKATASEGTPPGGTGGNTTGGGNIFPGTGGSTTGGGTTINKLQTDLVLKLGSRGPEVVELQRYLNSIHKQPPPYLVQDGIFGPLTQNMVKLYNNGYGETTLASIKFKNALKIF